MLTEPPAPLLNCKLPDTPLAEAPLRTVTLPPAPVDEDPPLSTTEPPVPLDDEHAALHRHTAGHADAESPPRTDTTPPAPLELEPPSSDTTPPDALLLDPLLTRTAPDAPSTASPDDKRTSPDTPVPATLVDLTRTVPLLVAPPPLENESDPPTSCALPLRQTPTRYPQSCSTNQSSQTRCRCWPTDDEPDDSDTTPDDVADEPLPTLTVPDAPALDVPLELNTSTARWTAHPHQMTHALRRRHQPSSLPPDTDTSPPTDAPVATPPDRDTPPADPLDASKEPPVTLTLAPPNDAAPCTIALEMFTAPLAAPLPSPLCTVTAPPTVDAPPLAPPATVTAPPLAASLVPRQQRTLPVAAPVDLPLPIDNVARHTLGRIAAPDPIATSPLRVAASLPLPLLTDTEPPTTDASANRSTPPSRRTKDPPSRRRSRAPYQQPVRRQPSQHDVTPRELLAEPVDNDTSPELAPSALDTRTGPLDVDPLRWRTLTPPPTVLELLPPDTDTPPPSSGTARHDRDPPVRTSSHA
ncbi:hypothetical protein PINS_up020346 [Pythium insidiosum]|nr:hypothetical protein PINS_up020346 [Pythium insidiosum]